MMDRIFEIAARFPRVTAGICFGTAAATTTHFAWIPDTPIGGRLSQLTLCAGLAHAASAAVLGRRLLDRARTRTAGQARALGAMTSVIACVIFAIGSSLLLQSSNAAQHESLSFLAYVPFVALFSFLAVGWALMLVSIAVAWGLFELLPPNC